MSCRNIVSHTCRWVSSGAGRDIQAKARSRQLAETWLINRQIRNTDSSYTGLIRKHWLAAQLGLVHAWGWGMIKTCGWPEVLLPLNCYPLYLKRLGVYTCHSCDALQMCQDLYPLYACQSWSIQANGVAKAGGEEAMQCLLNACQILSEERYQHVSLMWTSPYGDTMTALAVIRNTVTGEDVCRDTN